MSPAVTLGPGVDGGADGAGPPPPPVTGAGAGAGADTPPSPVIGVVGVVTAAEPVSPKSVHELKWVSARPLTLRLGSSRIVVTSVHTPVVGFR